MPFFPSEAPHLSARCPAVGYLGPACIDLEFMPLTPSLSLRAGLLLGALRTVWMAVEHLAGIRTTHLDWVEGSYGLFLLVGAPLLWAVLLAPVQRGPSPLALRDLMVTGLGAGVISGLIHVAVFWTYTEFLHPEFLDAFIAWNAENSSNTLDIAEREFRLPAFLDILFVHPLLFNPLTAVALGGILAKRAK